MKPRKAQELHAHDGIGSIGKGQRGFQIVAESGDSGSSWGRQGLGRIQTNAWSDSPVSNPDGTTGLALSMFRRAIAGKVSNSESAARALLGSVTTGPTGGAIVDALDPNRPEVRWRWRFGPGAEWIQSDRWAAILGDNGYGLSWQFNVRLRYDLAYTRYTISGGALVQDTSYESWVNGPMPSAGSRTARYFAVGGSDPLTGNLCAAFSTGTAKYRSADAVIDLGISWLPGDLITWDITWPVGAADVTMKVWRQRNVDDAPVSVEFSVPWQCLPLECAGASFLPATASAGYFDPGTSSWRQTTVNLSWTITPTSYSVTATRTDPPVGGETGPYWYGELLFDGNTNKTVGGPVGAGGTTWSGALVATSFGRIAVSGDPVTSVIPATPTKVGCWQDPDFIFDPAPISTLLAGDQVDAALPTQRLYWVGFVDPRPTDDYGLGVIAP